MNTVVSEGMAIAEANENLFLSSVDSLPGEKKLYLIEWEANGKKYGSHYINGFPPFDLERYRSWLVAISQLPAPFDANGCFI
jgi:hypothetical protein